MNLRVLGAAVVLVIAGLTAGCTGAKDKGKHQDYDRPKATAK
jgi:hypothetical protein